MPLSATTTAHFPQCGGGPNVQAISHHPRDGRCLQSRTAGNSEEDQEAHRRGDQNPGVREHRRRSQGLLQRQAAQRSCTPIHACLRQMRSSRCPFQRGACCRGGRGLQESRWPIQRLRETKGRRPKRQR